MPQLIPTKLDVSPLPYVQQGKATYPKPKAYLIEGLKRTVDTYDGKFDITLPLVVSANAKPGSLPLKGKIRYQACDNKICFPPTYLPFETTLDISMQDTPK